MVISKGHACVRGGALEALIRDLDLVSETSWAQALHGSYVLLNFLALLSLPGSLRLLGRIVTTKDSS